MKYEQTVQVELQEYVCIVKRIDGVVAQKALEHELIRCKDCKYFTRYKDCIEMYMWDGECSEWVSHTYLDWFCSRAERKEE